MDAAGQKLGSKAQVVAGLSGSKKSLHGCRPHLLEMLYKSPLLCFLGRDFNLDTTRISDSSMKEANSLEHWRKECKLLFETSVYHF
jgi:hypothetical protein